MTEDNRYPAQEPVDKQSEQQPGKLPEASAWVLTTKRVGDKVAGWVINSLDESNIRRLDTSERCEVTSFCYPTGARVVRARLSRQDY